MEPCSKCGTPLSPDANFCPMCGAKLKEPPPSTSIVNQIVIYFVSLFLPPFGLGYAYKYIRYGNQAGRIIGFVALGLTIFGLLLTLWVAQTLVNQIAAPLQELNDLGL